VSNSANLHSAAAQNNKDLRSQHIVFFDGDCGLCNRLVQLLFKIDEQRIFSVAPLQGISARQLLPENFTSELSTIVVYIPASRLLLKSDAIIAIATKMGGIYSIAHIFRLFPHFMRDFIYDLVARNRHRVKLTVRVCDRPTPENSGRILP
jgi:predicted DCC family thiol-disulfide oxidoreductase YuxK